jgi:hypothetical protein
MVFYVFEQEWGRTMHLQDVLDTDEAIRVGGYLLVPRAAFKAAV